MADVQAQFTCQLCRTRFGSGEPLPREEALAIGRASSAHIINMPKATDAEAHELLEILRELKTGARATPIVTIQPEMSVHHLNLTAVHECELGGIGHGVFIGWFPAPIIPEAEQ